MKKANQVGHKFEERAEQTDARHRDPLKIGEVSKLSGVSIESLRFYERQGLLGNPARTRSGYRMYDRAVLDRLEFVKRAQVLGFSLAEIARIISEKEAGQSPCAEVREIVRRRLHETDQRMEEMRRYRDDLASALVQWDEAGDVEGHICGLIEGTRIEHSVAGPSNLKGRKR